MPESRAARKCIYCLSFLRSANTEATPSRRWSCRPATALRQKSERPEFPELAGYWCSVNGSSHLSRSIDSSGDTAARFTSGKFLNFPSHAVFRATKATNAPRGITSNKKEESQIIGYFRLCRDAAIHRVPWQSYKCLPAMMRSRILACKSQDFRDSSLLCCFTIWHPVGSTSRRTFEVIVNIYRADFLPRKGFERSSASRQQKIRSTDKTVLRSL